MSTAVAHPLLSQPLYPTPPPPTGFRRIAAALTYRDFRVLWFGAFTSTIGTWMQKVAQNWLVLTITGSSSAFFLGLDSFLGELPILLFTLVGGVVADRYDRRRLLLTSQYIQMTAAFTLAALVYFGTSCASGTCWRCRSSPASRRRSAGRRISRCCRRSSARTHVPERDRVQLDSVQPGARDRTAARRRGARRVRHGRVLRPQRPVVPRGHRRDPVAARPTHSAHGAERACVDELKSGFAYVRAASGAARPRRARLRRRRFSGNPLLTFLPLFAQNVFHGGVDAVHASDVVRRRRRRHRRARRRVARQVHAHGPHAAHDAGRLRRAHRRCSR